MVSGENIIIIYSHSCNSLAPNKLAIIYIFCLEVFLYSAASLHDLKVICLSVKRDG